MEKIIILFAIFLIVVFFFKWKHEDKYSTGDGSHHHRIGHKQAEGFSIDFYAYISKIRCWNATFKVSLSVLILILCIVLDNPYVN